MVKKKKRNKKDYIVRAWSFGPCPTADELRAAWANRRASQKDFIWLLSILGELTCYTDCNLKHLGGFGHIAGRQGGLKAWIACNAPDLIGKYKSISRHATLAFKLKKAFNYYPPAPLSLLHPDLPKPRRIVPYIAHYAETLRETHFRDVEPNYTTFMALVTHQLKSHPPRLKWGPALPQDRWEQAEENWHLKYVVSKARAHDQAEWDRWLPNDQKDMGFHWYNG